MQADILLILVALLFVFLNGFFVATEFAIVKLRPSRVQALIAEEHPKGKLLFKLTSNIDEYLSACQLGITLSSLGLGWTGEPVFAHLIQRPLEFIGIGNPVIIHSIALALAFTTITVLHIVFGELAPKSLAIQYAESTALIVARPIDWFYQLAYPAIRALNWSGNWVVRLAGMQPANDHGLVHTEEELKLILRDSHESGILTKGEKDLMDNVFEFADTKVRQVMVPRGDIAYFDINKSVEENMDIIRETGYTRYPLCDGDIDHTLGMVHVKDLLLPAKQLKDPKELLTFKRKLLIVPEMISIQGALNDMRKEKTLLAMVVDEYGVVSGLVTLEDIVEELIGEIQDEFDQEHPLIYPTKDGSYIVDGMAPIEELGTILGLQLEDEESDTISGHILSQLGRVAVVGDVVKVGDYFVRVLHLSGLRISKLLFTKRDPKARPEEQHVSQITSVAELRDKLKARRQRIRNELAESGSRQNPRGFRAPRKESAGPEPVEAGVEAGVEAPPVPGDEEKVG